MANATDFRNGMALLTGAVNVITTAGPAGQAGFTASAVCSVTDSPATLLVCVNRNAFTHKFLTENKKVCVNVLAGNQADVSTRFSDKSISMEQRFATTPWQTLSTGAPALTEALVNFDGEVAVSQDVGTHTVFFVEIKEVRVADGKRGGLAYFDRAYHTLPHKA